MYVKFSVLIIGFMSFFISPNELILEDCPRKSNYPLDNNNSEYAPTNDLTLLWEPGQEVWIKFMGGSQFQRNKVKEIASQWTNYANLKFIFKQQGYAHIRIGFKNYDGNWSLIGRNATRRSQSKATMNIDLDFNNSESDWKRIVLHEFGHALGLVHEHQNPCDNPIKFTSYQDVIEFYKENQGWDEAKIRHNVLNKIVNSTYCWPFDKASIMLYSINSTIRRDKTELLTNYKLSPADKAFIQFLYPN